MCGVLAALAWLGCGAGLQQVQQEIGRRVLEAQGEPFLTFFTPFCHLCPHPALILLLPSSVLIPIFPIPFPFPLLSFPYPVFPILFFFIPLFLLLSPLFPPHSSPFPLSLPSLPGHGCGS